jgi:hypothetical protein
MAIDQTGVIDFAGIDPNTDEAILFITDHLEWENDDELHMSLLQEKINAYVRSIESGEIYQLYPKASGRELLIRVVSKYPMSAQANIFCERIRVYLLHAGFKIEFKRSSAANLEGSHP